MRSRPTDPSQAEAGTASLELVGTIPFLLAAVLVAAQIGLAGHALWSSAIAARAGARAAVVGRDAAAAARRALPPAMRTGARVEGSGPVSVEVAVPRLVPGLPSIRVGSGTGLGPGG